MYLTAEQAKELSIRAKIKSSRPLQDVLGRIKEVAESLPASEDDVDDLLTVDKDFLNQEELNVLHQLGYVVHEFKQNGVLTIKILW